MSHFLRDNYCIIRFEFDVLAEVVAFDDAFVVDAVYFVLTVFVAQEDDFFLGSPFRETAGQGKSLQYGEVLGQGILAPIHDFTQDVKLFAQRLPDIDGHHRIRDIGLEPAFDHPLQLQCRQTRSLDVVQQRK